MSKSFKEDLTGQRFGRLTVLEFVPKGGRNSYWRCRCDCGNIVVVAMRSLKAGDTKSCGCYRNESRALNKTIHGENKNRLHRIWRHMMARCNNLKNKHYKFYGARGITICSEWENFFAFKDWAMENGYDDTLTIDRIDVNGNYEPNNCRWITNKEQQRNKRNNKMAEYNGEKMCLAEASRLSGIKYMTLMDRYNKGDRGEKLFRSVK